MRHPTGLPGFGRAATALVVAFILTFPSMAGASRTGADASPPSSLGRSDAPLPKLEPDWVEGGGLSEAGEALLMRLEGAEAHGLEPQAYGVGEIRMALDRGDFNAAAMGLRVAYLRYAADLMRGRGTEPENENTLLAGLANAPAPGIFLDFFPPLSEDYRRLQDALAAHRLIRDSGGWPTVSDGPTLRPGDEDPRVLDVRERLVASGDLASDHLVGTMYDAVVEDAVARFQERHGLSVDGLVGPRTLAAMNVPVARRIEQIVINLDRLRSLDRPGPRLHVMVNVAGHELSVHEDGRELARMRVAVGQPSWPTPIFSDEITYLEFNPYWNVPASITREELAVQEAMNPGTLESRGFEALLGYGGERIPISAVDWPYAAETGRVPVVLRQRPGPGNALGKVKFMFPNEHSVYLHDTPDKSVFRRSGRAVSHGCVRVQDPELLAEILLTRAGGMEPHHVESLFARTDRKVVSLEEPVPVYLNYFTAWVSSDGTPHFREDIYDRDTIVPDDRPPVGEVLASVLEQQEP